jgi:hypothetical protein
MLNEEFPLTLLVTWSIYALTWLCYDTCNAMDNRLNIKSTPAIFSVHSWTTDVVITVENEQAFGIAKHVLASHLWLIQAVERAVDCNERCTYAALIIHCVDCIAAEYLTLHSLGTNCSSFLLFILINKWQFYDIKASFETYVLYSILYWFFIQIMSTK